MAGEEIKMNPLQAFALNAGLSPDAYSDMAFELSIYMPNSYRPNWNKTDSIYNQNYTGFSGNWSSSLSSSSVNASDIADMYAPFQYQSTGLKPWKPSGKYAPKQEETKQEEANQAEYYKATGNNKYSYEVDKKTGCITYKDPKGNKITVTEARKHMPTMVEQALALSKKVKAQNEAES